MIKKSSVDPQNIYKVIDDFKMGDEVLSDITPAITIFGSARTQRGSKEYTSAVELSHMLAKSGFHIITGGGPGIMQAANEGAFRESSIKSIGLGVKLPFETNLNQYTTVGKTFDYFFSRKVMMVKYSIAYIIYPGGFGTLDELFELLTLMQTGKAEMGKIFVVGEDYYKYLFKFIKKDMIEQGYINESDLDMLELSDDIDYINKTLTKAYIQK